MPNVTIVRKSRYVWYRSNSFEVYRATVNKLGGPASEQVLDMTNAKKVGEIQFDQELLSDQPVDVQKITELFATREYPALVWSEDQAGVVITDTHPKLPGLT